jgi:hypothetical protein
MTSAHTPYMTIEQRRERRQEILQAYKGGGTLQAVGDQFGITRERIRQIIGDEMKEAKVTRKHSVDIRLQASLQQAVPLYMSQGAEAVAEKLNMSPARTKSLIREYLNREQLAVDDRRNRKLYDKQYTHADLAAAVRTATRMSGVSDGGAVSVPQYTRLAKTHGLPSSVTVMYGLGCEYWNDAMKKLGYSPRQANRKTYTRRFDRDMCIEAVAALWRSQEKRPTVAEYEAHSKGVKDLPSVSLVRQRVGDWADIIVEASKLI